MADRVVLGVLLVVLPIAFNALFMALARAFEYPDILRRETSEILGRFTAGGRRLLLLWWAFMATAVALVPVAALLAAHLAPAGAAIAATSLALGVTAGLVQAMGLARWPFLVPVLASRYAGAGSDAERAATAIVFDAAHRYLGVAVGEHLGYLLTGAWTVVVGLGIVVAPGSLAILGWAGVLLGVLLAAGSLEFVGRPGDRGWPFAEKLVPIAYLGWSAWLLGVGAAILAGAA
jgi:hypothetical protein